jgi:uncharacterized protein (TIGR00297 family)
VTTPVRRAAAFAVVGSLALTVPLLGLFVAVPFAAIAMAAIAGVIPSPLFELFARPGDRQEGRLYGLAGFTLSVTALAVLLVPDLAYPPHVFAATVCLLAFGNLGEFLVRRVRSAAVLGATGFVVAGTLAGTGAQLLVGQALGMLPAPEIAAFLAASGALLAALIRSVQYTHDDPPVLLSVGLVLWLFHAITPAVSVAKLAVAVAVVAGLSAISYRLETASVTGMLTGATVALVTLVFGGVAWFAALVTFFGVGGLSTKFRYEEKRSRGVAEPNEGARGIGNVLGNAAVALVAVIAYAATMTYGGLPPALFQFVFLGSLATALADTLASEIGGVYDNPRLVTTLRRVEPGTDGAITWQGEVAGVGGAALVALVAAVLFPDLSQAGTATILLAGVGGMTADSLLGATVEGQRIGNQSVNFLATLAGAALAVIVAVSVGVVALPG